jgi:Phage tail tube protein
MPQPGRKAGIKGAFSLKQQTAYGTGIPDVDLTECHPWDGTITDFSLNKINNANHAGKGHEHPTWSKNTTCSTSASFKFPGSSYAGLFVAGFGLGDNASIQPDIANAPNTWQHTLKEMNIDDPAVGAQLPQATFVDQIREGWQRKYRDMVVKSFSLSGEMEQMISIQADFLGSGHYSKSSITMPDLVSTSFLMFSKVLLTYNGTNIESKLQSVNFQHTNNLNERGYYPQSPHLDLPGLTDPPQCRSKCLVNTRTNELKFTMVADDDSIDLDVLNNTEIPITLSAVGSLIEDTFYHQIDLVCPRAVLKTAPLTEKDGFFVSDVTCQLNYDATIGAPYQFVITTNIPSILGLPA